MTPKPNHLDDFHFRKNLVNQTVLNVNPPRIGPGQIPNKFLEGGRVLERIGFQYFQQALRLRLQTRRRKLFSVFLGLFGVKKAPAHQLSFLESLLTGVLSPARMDSRIPGIETR